MGTFQDLEDIPMPETVELLHSTVKPQIQSHIRQSSTGNTPPEINITLDQEDYIQMFSKWKEKTTTSPSGRHLGHYKAILKEKDIIQYHYIMSELPLKYGFTPTRWTRAIQIMLEADLNWVLRLIWGQRLFKNSVKTQTLMTAQQARPGYHSITAPLNKVLAYDHMCLTKRDGASFDNDAEGCYDRIVPPHALLCCRRMGLPKSAA